jgi:hydroxymethylglutaryl-CoA lyase
MDRNKIKIFEMFLRDGLQSYKTVYTVPQKLSFLKHLQRCNYDCIEFGSTTSPKLIPQIGGSFELWQHIKENKTKETTKYTMLVPSINHLERVQKEDIRSFGLVTSLSDEFSQRNMKMTGEQSVDKAIEMCDAIFKDNATAHVRVYISCSFGCPWEGFTEEHKGKLAGFIERLMDVPMCHSVPARQFDIVLADTVGMCTEERMKELLGLQSNRDNPYLALHMHFTSKKGKDGYLEQSFDKVVDMALNMGIEKFDTSLLGIGGCPYAKKAEGEIIGNLSTRPFVEFLNKQGMETNVDLDKLVETEGAIYTEMN